jgi:hypothetical protein
MKTFDGTLAARITDSAAKETARGAERGNPSRAAAISLALVLGWIGWNAAIGAYTPGSAFGYLVGVTGASLLLLLLLYPLRKRMRFAKRWAPLKYWFCMHMLCGIAGPLLVLFHATFRLRSLNATVAMGCMLLVAGSGLIGRFIYRRIHHGLYGARASLKEMQQALSRELAEMERVGQPAPAVKREIEAYAQLAGRQPVQWYARAWYFVALGVARLMVQYRIGRAIAALPGGARADRDSLRRASCDTLRAMQRVAQFTAYERLFSLWHILHVPFVFMLVASAVVHVVAVHMY